MRRHGFGCRAPDTLSWTFHMAFGGCWAGVEIFGDEVDANVGATGEETTFHSF